MLILPTNFIMKYEEYYNEISALFKEWGERRSISNPDAKFVYDGVSGEWPDDMGISKISEKSWQKWEDAKPKIMFLIKEAWGGYQPEIAHDAGSRFGWNMMRWKKAIEQLYLDGTCVPAYISNDEASISNEGCAIVEVKKWDEDLRTSTKDDILAYARRDGDLLRKEIDLIGPEVVLCDGTTFTAYNEFIYPGELKNAQNLNYIPPEETADKISASIILHKQKNRLVLNFYHPSARYSAKSLHDLLCRLFSKSDAFSKIRD